MKLGIDAREIQQGVYTGIGGSLADFLRYFARMDNDDSCVLFSLCPVPLDFGPRVKNIVCKEGITFYWDQVILPRLIKQEGIDLFYSPYYKIPLFKPCRTISAILDLMYLEFEEYRRQLNLFKKIYYYTFGKLFAHRADAILTCSEYSKEDVIRLYQVPSIKIKVIPLSISDTYKPETDVKNIEAMKQRFGISSRYILYMGNFKPHKNVKRIIQAFKKILLEFKDLQLVLAGPKTHGFEELKIMAREMSLEDKVIFTGKILEKDQPQILYSGAQVFVMPSFYEGFGLPPVEAMACGTPVVAADTTSIPEVVKDAGILVEPHSIDAIAASILQLLKDETKRKDCIDKGLKYAQEYSRKKVGKQMYDFFRAQLLI